MLLPKWGSVRMILINFVICVITGKVTLPSRQSNITHFVKLAYHAYFGVKLGDQDKAFAPHTCSNTGVLNLFCLVYPLPK